MKRIQMRSPTFAPTTPRPLPPNGYAPVPVDPAEVLAVNQAIGDDPREEVLPPSQFPPQMSHPVGPPPVAGKTPENYQEFVELIEKVSKGPMTDKAILWATLANAQALNRIGDLLEAALTLGKAAETKRKPGRPPKVHKEVV